MRGYLTYIGMPILIGGMMFLTSCRKDKKDLLTPTSSGQAYELLVVAPYNVWKRPAGRALYDVLDSDVPGLPQSERSFRIMYTSPQDYDATLKLVRNIIVVQIDKERYTQPGFKYEKDVYAYPQSILNIQAANEDSLAEFITHNGQQIIDFFTHAEMNRQMALLERRHNKMVTESVQAMFGYNIWVPAELTGTKRGKDFFWAGTNAATEDRNFVIYTYPYTGKETFTKTHFVHKRDSVMQVNIPGAQEGMYMATDSINTSVRQITLHNDRVLEARGLWRMKGDFMGGPFVSLSRIDKKNRRIVVTEVFVYAPDKLKRNLIRQMEASLYTLRMSE